MAASHSDAAKLEQIITEFFAKSLHIILESRDPCVALRDFNKESSDSSPSSSSVRPRDKWFNLALKECPAAFENLDLWCWSNPESMVVDVILVKRMVESVCGNPEESTEGSERSEQIIERWVVKYEIRRTESEGSSKGRKRSSKSILRSLYKKSILVLRSLYTTVRLLPAYKLFRQLSLSGSLCSCFLAHRVSSSADPFDPKEEAKMQLHGFAPLDTSYGKLQISVLYLSRISGVAHQTSSMSMAPKFIPDYVGSSLAEPVKRLPSLLGEPGSFPSRQYMLANYDHCQASPPSFTSSASSTHSESCALPLPYPFISSSNSARGADGTARLMQDGVVVDKVRHFIESYHSYPTGFFSPNLQIVVFPC